MGGGILKNYFETLKNYVTEHQPDYGDGNAQSILEMLYACSNQYNRMDTEEIKAGFDDLYRHMNGIPLRDMDGIIYTVCALCRDHEKAGFIEGVKVGIQLAKESAAQVE